MFLLLEACLFSFFIITDDEKGICAYKQSLGSDVDRNHLLVNLTLKGDMSEAFTTGLILKKITVVMW